MTHTLFVNRAKIIKSAIIGAGACTLFLSGGVWLAMYFDLAHNISMLSLVFTAAYVFFAVKWIQSLVALYKLALQKEPYVTMTEEHIIFTQPQGTVSIPWGRVIRVQKYSANALILHFSPDTKVPFRFPFAKVPDNVMATISLCDRNIEEVYDLVMQHAHKFNQSDTGDARIVQSYQPKIMDYLLFANGVVVFMIYHYTASIKIAAVWFALVLITVIACSLVQNYYFQDEQ